MNDFSEISRELVEAGGAMVVQSADNLFSTIAELIADPHERQRIGANAQHYIKGYDTVLAEHMQVIDCYL